MKQYKLASSTWDKKELDAIQSVIDKDMYTMGDSVYEFESDFSKFMNTKYSVMVSSGSTANLLATAALFFTKNPKLKRGDEVIVPAVSWSTTYFPLQQYGLKLKFVDIDLDTLNYDLKKLHGAISSSTKMIMIVNLLGNPNDLGFGSIQNGSLENSNTENSDEIVKLIRPQQAFSGNAKMLETERKATELLMR